MLRAKVVTLFCFTVASFFFFENEALAATDELAVVDYHYVSRARVGRAFYDYTYTISVRNSGEALRNVVATAASTTQNTQIVQGIVPIGDIGAQASEQSTETLVFRQNRRFLFKPESIVWTFAADPAEQTNTAPVSDAGPDQSVVSGMLVTLDGTASTDADGDAITYAWRLITVPAGSIASLDDPASAMPSFIADVPGDYVAELVVNDGTEDSAPDTAVVSTANTPPVADAGLDQTAPVGATVSLFGGASSDANGDPLTYAWSILSAPDGSSAALVSQTGVQTSFVIDVAGEYVIELVVNDGFEDSVPDTAVVTTENTPPVADAGLDQTVEVGDMVVLDGTFSFDVDDDPLTYLWSLISIPEGSQALIADAIAATASFVADLEGIYVAQLIVNDGTVDSDPDTGVVTATVGNQAPTAVAGVNTASVVSGESVQLDGSASSDPDGDPLTYLWSLAVPSGSATILSSTTDIAPSFTTDLPGAYIATLVVNDGNLDSEAVSVLVTARPQVNTAPQLVPIGDRAVTLGTTLQFRLFAIDPDIGDTLTFSLPSPIDGIEVDGASGDVSFTPVAAQIGANNVTARVEDSGGLFDTQTFTIDVQDALAIFPRNDPPTLEPIPDQVVTVGDTLSVQASGSDSGGAVTYSLPVSSAGTTIDATGRITFTPTPEQVGRHDVSVRVVDTGGAAAFQSFVVTVDAVDRPPIALDDIYTARIGDTLNVAAPGILGNDNDPDGDPLTAVLVSDSTTGDLNLNADGSFSYRPQTPLNRIVPVPVAGDLTQLVAPVRVDTSSYRSDDSAAMALDGDPATSWFTADGDAANLGGTPFYQLTFPEDVTVTNIEMLGNRDPADGFDFLRGMFQLFDSDGNELYNSGDVALAAPDRDINLDVGSIGSVRQFRFTGTADESLSPGFSELRIIGSAVTRTYKRAENVNLTRFGPVDPRSSPSNGSGYRGGTESGVDQTPMSFWQDGLDTEDPFYEISFPAGEVTVREVQMIVRRNAFGTPLTTLPFTSARITLLDSGGATVFDSGLLEGLIAGQDLMVPVPDVENVRTVRFEGAPNGGTFGELVVVGDGLIWPIRPELEWSWTEPDPGTAPGGTSFGNVSVTPLSVDLDGDGFMELVFSASTRADGSNFWPAHLVVLDGRTGDQIAILDDPTLRLDGPSSMAVGDIDGDGLPEIIATAESARELIAFEHDLSVKWRSEPINGTIWGSISIANIDGEGLPEILAGNQVLNANGEVLWTGVSSGTSGRNTIAADLDLDGQMEVIMGGDVYSSDGTLLWRRDLANAPSAAVGNFDDDPYAEVVISTRNRMEVFEHDGTLKWSRLNGDIGGGAPTVADYDGDGKPEIGQLSSRNYTVYDTDGRIMWQMPVFDGSASTSSTVFDLDGDGSAEVIMRDEDFLRIFRGADGELLFQFQISSSTAGEGPMVADIDSDGQAEIVVGSTAASRQLEPTKGIFVFGGFDGDWVRTRTIWNQHDYHVTNVNPDLTIPVVERHNWLTPGLNNYRQNAFSPDDLDRLESFEYRAAGAGQESNTARVLIDTQAPNSAPVITSTPATTATIGFEYFYAVSANDADFDPLTFSLVEGPSAMRIDPMTGLARWTPGDGDAGRQFVTVSVADPGGKVSVQRYELSTNTGVAVPDVVALARPAAEAVLSGANLQVGTVRFSDHPSIPLGAVAIQEPPAGSVARFGGSVSLVVSLGAGPADIDDDGDGFTVNQGDCNDADDSIFPGAPDIAGDGIDQDCDGSDASVPPVEILVTPPVSTVLAGEIASFNATGIYEDGTSQNLTAIADWTNGPSFGSPDAGSFIVTASLAGVSGSATVDVVASVGDDAIAPLAAIVAPEANVTITGPVDIVGTASDANFLKYELGYAIAGSTDFTTLAVSTTPVTDAVLGRFDPTVLMNDLYTIRLTVFDTGGNRVFADTTVQVDENLKVGNFSLSFTDLQIPMAGIPITVTRSYDSRDKRQGDFGIGWHLDVGTLTVRSNRVQGTGWRVERSGFSFILVPTDAHTVSLTLPGGRVEEFELEVTPQVSPVVPFPPFVLQARYRPRPGTIGQLESLETNFVSILDAQPGDVTLTDDVTGRVYNPGRFRYTTADGRRLIVSVERGIEAITDRNGNTLTFGEDGIVHSAGNSVVFDRDDFGRITRIIDPMGNVQRYAYDANGDLVSYFDQDGNETRMKYQRNHFLIELIDPLGNRATRNEYDDEGRLVAQIDANGNRKTFSHDLGSMVSEVVDREGARTVYAYDTNGNVTSITDGVGETWSFDHDPQGNVLRAVDPLGNVETFTYDENNNVTSVTDPLGNTVTMVYNELGDLLSETDELGFTTSFEYDARGNMTTMIDPSGTVTGFAYDANGNLLAITDPEGNTAVAEYNAFGQLTAVEDASGVRQEWVLNANGVMTTKRRQTVTNSGTAVSETNFQYDQRGNVRQFSSGDGARVATVDWDIRNMLSGASDAEGDSWTVTRDALGNILSHDVPGRAPLFVETDAVGRIDRMTSPTGAVFERSYDANGRLTESVVPGMATQSSSFDAAGRQISSTDGNLNSTSMEYDDAGRLTREVRPGGAERIREYDDAGRLSAMTGPQGSRMEIERDSNGRPTSVILPDGTRRTTSYDANGDVTSQTDLLGLQWDYEYDERGNLESVTDPAGNAILLRFDNNGNLISFTDSQNRTTSNEFDEFGMLLRRTLPLGMSEGCEYDLTSRVRLCTGFGGDTVAYEYDDLNRTVTRSTSDGDDRYFYDDAEQLIRIESQAGGVSEFQRDQLGRLTRWSGTGSRVAEYTYDALGNVTEVRANGSYGFEYNGRREIVGFSGAGGDVSISRDLNGRVAVTEFEGGITRSVDYDAVGRIERIGYDSSGSSIHEWLYAYDMLGRVASVSDSTGRTIRYRYDELGRIAEELTERPGLAGALIEYEYDLVGNMTARIEDGIVQRFTYDANDRLLSDGESTYGWDADGNLVLRQNAASVEVLEYDSLNRLVAFHRSGANPVSVAYTYDHDGLLASREVDGNRELFVWDVVSATFPQLLEIRDAAGNLIRSFGHDELHLTHTLESGGAASIFVYDRLGSVHGIARSDGTVSIGDGYDAFGRARGSTTAGIGFTGAYTDSETNLVFMRSRWLSPAMGRFIQMDSAAIDYRDSRTINRYSYASNDPVNRIDPDGQVDLPQLITSVSIISTVVAVLDIYRRSPGTFVSSGFGARKVWQHWGERQDARFAPIIPFAGGQPLFLNFDIGGPIGFTSGLEFLQFDNVGKRAAYFFLGPKASASWNPGQDSPVPLLQASGGGGSIRSAIYNTPTPKDYGGWFVGFNAGAGMGLPARVASQFQVAARGGLGGSVFWSPVPTHFANANGDPVDIGSPCPGCDTRHSHGYRLGGGAGSFGYGVSLTFYWMVGSPWDLPLEN